MGLPNRVVGIHLPGSMIKSPCFGCENRHISCHSECEKYVQYRKYREKSYEERRKMVEFEESFNSVRSKGVPKSKRRGRN